LIVVGQATNNDKEIIIKRNQIVMRRIFYLLFTALICTSAKPSFRITEEKLIKDFTKKTLGKGLVLDYSIFRIKRVAGHQKDTTLVSNAQFFLKNGNAYTNNSRGELIRNGARYLCLVKPFPLVYFSDSLVRPINLIIDPAYDIGQIFQFLKKVNIASVSKKVQSSKTFFQISEKNILPGIDLLTIIYNKKNLEAIVEAKIYPNGIIEDSICITSIQERDLMSDSLFNRMATLIKDPNILERISATSRNINGMVDLLDPINK
jgi:hypothetical protein